MTGRSSSHLACLLVALLCIVTVGLPKLALAAPPEGRGNGKALGHSKGNGTDDSTSNSAPVISGTPAGSITEGNIYDFTPSAEDADNDQLIFSIVNKPRWASFDQNTGRLSGTPIAGDAGDYANIQITVSDGQASASLAFDVRVEETAGTPPPPPANNAPTISGSPAATVEVDQNYAFTPTASDADNDELTFSISNKPAWLTFNANTGGVAGTPTVSNVGNYTDIRITVSDGQANATLAFDVSVPEPPTAPPANSAPTISGSPSTSVAEGDQFQFTPTANDGDNDTLSFSVANKPSWAAFDSVTGRISGVPGAADVGSYIGIRITVSDGQASASLSFDLDVVTVGNTSVIVSWTAPTENSDGSVLTDLAGYRLYFGTSLGSKANTRTINNASISTYVLENLTPATYYLKATAFNEDGEESDLSEEISFQVR